MLQSAKRQTSSSRSRVTTELEEIVQSNCTGPKHGSIKSCDQASGDGTIGFSCPLHPQEFHASWRVLGVCWLRFIVWVWGISTQDLQESPMIRFTTRELMGLTAVAGLSCVIGIASTPTGQLGQAIASVIIFAFGGSCYATGVYIGKTDNVPS